MSDARGTVDRSTATDLNARWPWFVALGIGLLALSVVAWVDSVAVTVVSAIVIGGSLAAGGVFHIWHSLVAGNRYGAALSLCSGILYTIGGLLTMREPVHGAAVLTLLLVITIVTGGHTAPELRARPGMATAAAWRHCQYCHRRADVHQPPLARPVGYRRADRR
jgi:uncharacterized membrane protein HdeD (DUF308 family)